MSKLAKNLASNWFSTLGLSLTFVCNFSHVNEKFISGFKKYDHFLDMVYRHSISQSHQASTFKNDVYVHLAVRLSYQRQRWCYSYRKLFCDYSLWSFVTGRLYFTIFRVGRFSPPLFLGRSFSVSPPFNRYLFLINNNNNNKSALHPRMISSHGRIMKEKLKLDSWILIRRYVMQTLLVIQLVKSTQLLGWNSSFVISSPLLKEWTYD